MARSKFSIGIALTTLLTLICTLFVNPTPTLYAGTSLDTMGWPFPSGQTWFVYQGYNGYTHYDKNGWDDTYAFDLVKDSWSNTVGSAGAQIIAPASGTTRINANRPTGIDVYITLADGHKVLLAHLMNITPTVSDGWVDKGEPIGQIFDGKPGGVNHLHIVVHDPSGSSLPLDFGVWNYPVPGPLLNGGPAGSTGQWRGTKIDTSVEEEKPVPKPIITLPPETSCLKPLLRYWNEDRQKHFYTADHDELGTGRNGWVYEKFEGYVAATADCYAPDAKPLHHLWHDGFQKHFYTASDGQATYAVEELGYKRKANVGYVLTAENSQYKTLPLYRLYKDSVHNHFYTTRSGEKDYAVEHHNYKYERVDGYVFSPDALRPPETECLKPLLRYWNASRKKHFYTSNWRELGVLKNGWVYENFQGYVAATPDCYAPDAKPFYRLWHDGFQKHFYTASPDEADYAVEHYGFKRERDVGYILRGPNSLYHTQPLHRLYKEAAQDHFYTRSAAERDYAVDAFKYKREGIAAYVFSSDALTSSPPRQRPPFFESNFTTGTPGSTFIFSAGAFSPGASVDIAIKEPDSDHFHNAAQLLLNTDGELVFMLIVPQDTRTGIYTVRMTVLSEEVFLAEELVHAVDLTISTDEPERPDTLFDPVPTVSLDTGTSDTSKIYLPLLAR
jgi:hypothetical protein